MAYNKVHHVAKCCDDIFEYSDHDLPTGRGVYSESRYKLIESVRKARKFVDTVSEYLVQIGVDPAELCDCAPLTELQCKSNCAPKTRNGKSSMYIDAIRLYRQVLSQIASDDQYEQPESKMLAEYLHRWFEVRIVEFCGRGKSDFRCTVKQYGLMLRALILMFVWCAEQDRLDRHSIGTKFSKEFDKWESSVRNTDDGRNQYALPFVAKCFYDEDEAYKVDYSEVYLIVRDLQDAGFMKLFMRDVPEEYRMYDKYFKED